MADERKAPVRHLQWNDIHYIAIHTSTSKRFAPSSPFVVCDMAVADSSILQCYLHAKNNKSYLKLMTFSEFRPWREFLSITGEYVFPVCDRCNKQFPQWVVTGDIIVPYLY